MAIKVDFQLYVFSYYLKDNGNKSIELDNQFDLASSNLKCPCRLLKMKLTTEKNNPCQNSKHIMVDTS